MKKTELERARIDAYRAGEWYCRTPPVCTGGWDEAAWIKWVTFKDPELNRSPDNEGGEK